MNKFTFNSAAGRFDSVEAVQVSDYLSDGSQMFPKWFSEIQRDIAAVGTHGDVQLDTSEGVVNLAREDWIVKLSDNTIIGLSNPSFKLMFSKAGE